MGTCEWQCQVDCMLRFACLLASTSTCWVPVLGQHNQVPLDLLAQLVQHLCMCVAMVQSLVVSGCLEEMKGRERGEQECSQERVKLQERGVKRGEEREVKRVAEGVQGEVEE